MDSAELAVVVVLEAVAVSVVVVPAVVVVLATAAAFVASVAGLFLHFQLFPGEWIEEYFDFLTEE